MSWWNIPLTNTITSSSIHLLGALPICDRVCAEDGHKGPWCQKGMSFAPDYLLSRVVYFMLRYRSCIVKGILLSVPLFCQVKPHCSSECSHGLQNHFHALWSFMLQNGGLSLAATEFNASRRCVHWLAFTKAPLSNLNVMLHKREKRAAITIQLLHQV